MPESKWCAKNNFNFHILYMKIVENDKKNV